jgi:hypothetical protein
MEVERQDTSSTAVEHIKRRLYDAIETLITGWTDCSVEDCVTDPPPLEFMVVLTNQVLFE